MNHIAIDPRQSGISGDMLIGSLSDLFSCHDLVNAVIAKIVAFFPGIRANYRCIQTKKFGLSGTFLSQEIQADFPKSPVSTLLQMSRELARPLNLSSSAVSFVDKVFSTIIGVEAEIHGYDKNNREEMHFHELNSIDTLIDILGVAAIIDTCSSWESPVYGLPICYGSGRFKFSHGDFAVPGPAVTRLLVKENIPSVQIDDPHELATVTGVALYSKLVTNSLKSLPLHTKKKIGLGFGSQALDQRPNFLKTEIIDLEEGSVPSRAFDVNHDQIMVLESHLDDITGELLGATFENLANEQGVLDVSVYPLIMKKNRPGHCIRVLCTPDASQRVSKKIIETTGTLGVRHYLASRHTAVREVVTKVVKFGTSEYPVRVKIAKYEGKTVSVKPEFDDLMHISRLTGEPITSIQKRILSEIEMSKVFYDQ